MTRSQPAADTQAQEKSGAASCGRRSECGNKTLLGSDADSQFSPCLVFHRLRLLHVNLQYQHDAIDSRQWLLQCGPCIPIPARAQYYLTVYLNYLVHYYVKPVTTLLQ